MDAAIAALLGAGIGAIGSVGGMWLQQRHQTRRELLKSKRPPCTVLDLIATCRQMSITWRSIANGTRQPEPPSHSTEAVR